MGLVIYKSFPKRLYSSSTYSRNINSAHCFLILGYIYSQRRRPPRWIVGRPDTCSIRDVLGRDSAPETENGARWITDTTKDTPNYGSSF